MATLPRDQVEVIIKNGEAKGISKTAVIDSLIKKGYEPEGLDIQKWNAAKAPTITTEAPAQEKNFGQKLMDRVSDTAGDVAQVVTDTAETSQKRADRITEIKRKLESGDTSDLNAIFSTTGQLAGAGADAIGNFFKGVVKVALKPETEQKAKELVGKFGESVVKEPAVQNIIKWYDSLEPNQKDLVDGAGGLIGLASEFVGVGLAKDTARVANEGISAGVDATKKAVKEGVDAVTTSLPSSETVSGIKQAVSSVGERLGRAGKRVKENIADNAVKAEKIANAPTPAIAEAIKVNTPDVIIETIQNADQPTKNALTKVLDIAEKPARLGTKKQPSIVSGDLAVDQYKLIDKKRIDIGKELGSAVDKLSKTTKVPMNDAYNQLDTILGQMDITVVPTKKGFKFDFTKSSLSAAQKKKVQELYKLSVEGGSELTPRQIYNKDRLFSQLKRESALGEIGDIRVDVGDGSSKSLFDAFKDVYSKTLDEVSPEDIRALNREYRKYRTMVDAIDDTLLRGADKLSDTPLIRANPAEFAKVNLRRIFGDSASSAEFEAVAKQMDALARELGYADADPTLVANFAQELRKIYPETVPATGFTGGIKTALPGGVDIINKALDLGNPNQKDIQKAIRAMLTQINESTPNK